MKKKILIICNVFPNISETFIRNHIDFLEEEGFEINILALHYVKKNNILKKYYNKTYGCKSLVLKVLYFPYFFIKMLFIDFFLTIKSINIFKYGKDALFLKIFYALLFTKKKKYDLIIAHFGRSGNIGAFLKSECAISSKLITLFHGRDIREGESKGNIIFNETFKHTNLFISVSNVSSNFLYKNNIDNGRIIDIPNGVNTKKFKIKKYLTNHRGALKILSVGRLVDEKNYMMSLMAIKSLIKKGINLEYSIIGDGPNYKKIKDYICKNNLNNKIKLLGAISGKKLIEKYLENDIFLLTSISETGPIVVLEALFSGLPVISTNVGRVSEFINDKKNGFLVDSIKRIEEKIIFFNKNKNEIEKMGLFGVNDIRNKFSQKKMNLKLLKQVNLLISDEYEDIL